MHPLSLNVCQRLQTLTSGLHALSWKVCQTTAYLEFGIVHPLVACLQTAADVEFVPGSGWRFGVPLLQVWYATSWQGLATRWRVNGVRL